MELLVRMTIQFVVLISLTHCTSTSPPSPITSQVAERNLSAVVEIMTDDSAGSGVLISNTGLVVTNFHVISGSRSIEVQLSNGDRYTPSGIVDFDFPRDIAILKIPGFDLPNSDLGNSNSVNVGDDVVVIGAPQGLSQSVSRGIISAIRDTGEGYSLLQTDSSISPGSSGGGMYDESGRLVGIVVSYLEGGQNLNFAVPVNYVRGLINEDIKYSMEEFIALQENLPLSESESRFASNEPVDMETFISRVESILEVRFDFLPDEQIWYVDMGDELLGVRGVGETAFTFITEYEPAYQLEQLSSDTLLSVLKLNYEANFAKISINESLTVTNESFYKSMTPNEYIVVLEEMITLHDNMKSEVYGNQSSTSGLSTQPSLSAGDLAVNRSPLFDTSPSGYQDIPLLGGTYEVSLDTQYWRSDGTDNTELTYHFINTQEGVSFSIIEEEGQYSYEYMLDVLTTNAEGGGLESVNLIDYGLREVNGQELLWANIDVSRSGARIRMYAHVYTGPEGTVQLVGTYPANIADRKAPTIDKVVGTYRLR